MHMNIELENEKNLPKFLISFQDVQIIFSILDGVKILLQESSKNEFITHRNNDNKERGSYMLINAHYAH